MSSPDYRSQTVRVSAESFYQPNYSKPLESLYIFAYRIRISNLGTEPTRLLRRHWIVTDGTGQVKEVEGEGVVGKQPLILPGQSHEYMSWIQLATPLGTMEGSYLMERPASTDGGAGDTFRAPIPRFKHLAPELFN